MPRLYGPSPVIDDRGVARSIVLTGDLWRDGRAGDPAFGYVIHRVSRAELSGFRRLRGTLLGLLWIVVLVVAVNYFTFLPDWTILIFMAVAMYAALSLDRRFSPRRSEARVADMLLADGVCPCCAYNLAAAEPQEGLVLCPECGAAWKATRILRRHEFVESSSERPPSVRRWLGVGASADASGPTRIRDDRNDPRPIVHARLREPVRHAPPEIRPRLLEAKSELDAIGRGQRIGCAVLAAVFYLGSLLFVLKRPTLMGVEWIMIVGLSLLILWVPMIVVRGAQHILPEEVRAALLKRLLCPSCAADLSRAAAGPDGCTPCPECGAAWRLAPGPTPTPHEPAPTDGR